MTVVLLIELLNLFVICLNIYKFTAFLLMSFDKESLNANTPLSETLENPFDKGCDSITAVSPLHQQVFKKLPGQQVLTFSL